MTSLGVLARTLRHLRSAQVTGQLRHRLSGPPRRPQMRLVSGAKIAMPSRLRALCPDAAFGPDGVRLFGRAAYDPTQNGWSAVGDPLWLYTLHYHGWLSAHETTSEAAETTVRTWIDQHHAGVGWEPYPTSMRLMHWASWLGRVFDDLTDELRGTIAASMAAQLRHLARNIETHIDGNHLWTNLAAIAVGSMLVEGSGVPRTPDALEQFARCVTDQLGADGVHRERTPTYHCILAEQLAMVLSIAGLRAPCRAIPLANHLKAMLDALPTFTHPDGDVALWGDSQRGASARPQTLRCAASHARPLDPAPADATAAGFSRRVWGPWTVLLNRGDISMPHQPGHIHGDALALELSFGSTRVLVDAGTGTYRADADRRYARSTVAHNTVTLETHPEHHELWASHRVGGRAVVEQHTCARDVWCASVRAFDAPSSHRREIERVGDMIVLRDSISPAADATARFFFPAELSVRPTAQGAVVVTPHGRFEVFGSTPVWWVEPAAGWSSIGAPASRVCLATKLTGGRLTTVFAPEPCS